MYNMTDHVIDHMTIIWQDLKAETGIDLENIVYYKDDTHYFVMTAKKESLLKKGVLIAVSHVIVMWSCYFITWQDYPDTRTLLHPSNINKEELYDYSVDAAGWSTELPQLDFAVSHMISHMITVWWSYDNHVITVVVTWWSCDHCVIIVCWSHDHHMISYSLYS